MSRPRPVYPVPMAQERSTATTSWWGKFRLGEDEIGRWRVGPLDLWVRRTALDWRYGARRGEDPLESTLSIRVPAAQDDLEALPEELARFGYAGTEETLELVPALADRPVVARPAVPFFVPPGQKVDLFVSTPVWIRLRAGKDELAQVPCTRPSDTWFGSNTRGLLAYAMRTFLRRSLDAVPQRPHRAVTWLSVKNDSDHPLALERLSLPAPQLSLFSSPSGALWTEHVRIKSGDDGEVAEVTLGKGAPRLVKDGKAVAPPRASQGRSFGSLVFGGLFKTGI